MIGGVARRRAAAGSTASGGKQILRAARASYRGTSRSGTTARAGAAILGAGGCFRLHPRRAILRELGTQ